MRELKSDDRVHHNGNCSWMKEFMEEAFGGWNE